MPVKSVAEWSKGEHSATLSTFIKPPFVIKIYVLSIFEWPFYTDFSVRIRIPCTDPNTFQSLKYVQCQQRQHFFQVELYSYASFVSRTAARMSIKGDFHQLCPFSKWGLLLVEGIGFRRGQFFSFKSSPLWYRRAVDYFTWMYSIFITHVRLRQAWAMLMVRISALLE